MIEPISASLDVYPHLRLDVSEQSRQRAQQRSQERAAELQQEQRQKTTDTLYLESDERRRQADRTEEKDDGKVVLFQQSATLENQQPGENAEAEEVLPALEASVLPRDLRLNYAVQLYNSASRLGFARETVGTRFSAVA